MSDSYIEIKINLTFYFHTSLWYLKRFGEDLLRASQNLLRYSRDNKNLNLCPGSGRERLSYFWIMFPFYAVWKHQKTKGFLVFSECVKWEERAQIIGKKAKECAYQGVRNVGFSGNFACFIFLKHPFWDSPFCLITDKMWLKMLWKLHWQK